MNFFELEKKQEDLTEKQAEFLSCHNQIMNCGRNIVDSIVELSKNLKRMRDEKLYLEADLDSFEEYAEKICGLKRSQAYSYIQVLERLGEDFVQSTGQIGITKLTMISSLSDEKKEALINSTDVESATVKELKNKIDSLQSDIDDKDDELESQRTKVEELKKQIAELEKAKSEIVQSTGQTSEKIQSTGQNEKKIVQSTGQIAELEKKINELKEKLKLSDEKLKASAEQLKINSDTIGRLKKEKDLNSNSQLVEFKYLFNDLQAIVSKIENILPQLPEDKQQGCMNALKKVGERIC